jgi:hypothetical protein
VDGLQTPDPLPDEEPTYCNPNGIYANKLTSTGGWFIYNAERY